MSSGTHPRSRIRRIQTRSVTAGNLGVRNNSVQIEGCSEASQQGLVIKIRDVNRKFRKACDQIILLNNQIEGLQLRYDRAMKANRRSFRYSLRLRLATLEGVRNMYYEYATRQADELEELQNELIDAGIEEEDFMEEDDY